MIIEKHGGEYYHCRIPGIVCTEKGSLLAYYECRKTDSDWSEIDIKIIKSTDNGKSWSTVKLINGNGNTLNNPVMTVNDNTLHLLWCENYKKVFHSISYDNGESWSEPTDITKVFSNIEHTVVASGPGHGIITHNGTMLIPVWFALNREDDFAHTPSFISVLYSRDNGKTWCIGEIIKDSILKNPSECALGILSDNSVVMSIRNENECRLRCFAKSKNGYEDWCIIGFDERFPDPICQGSMANGDGVLCHINCDDKNVRKNLSLKITDDDFKTFRSVKIDDYGGYSDICIKSNTAYIIYEATTDTKQEYYVNLKFKTVIINP